MNNIKKLPILLKEEEFNLGIVNKTYQNYLVLLNLSILELKKVIQNLINI